MLDQAGGGSKLKNAKDEGFASELAHGVLRARLARWVLRMSSESPRKRSAHRRQRALTPSRQGKFKSTFDRTPLTTHLMRSRPEVWQSSGRLEIGSRFSYASMWFGRECDSERFWRYWHPPACVVCVSGALVGISRCRCRYEYPRSVKLCMVDRLLLR